MSEHTELPELAVGYMDQGMGHGHYAVIVVETNELLNIKGQNKDRLELIVRACNSHKDLATACKALQDRLEYYHATHKDLCHLGQACPEIKALNLSKAAIAQANEET